MLFHVAQYTWPGLTMPPAIVPQKLHVCAIAATGLPRDSEFRTEGAAMRLIRGLLVIAVLVGSLWALFGRGNPGGISDAKYSEFKRLAPPKLLYSCVRKPAPEVLLQWERECWATGRAACEDKLPEWIKAGTRIEVEFAASAANGTYEELLEVAKHNCATKVENMATGEFKVLEASQR